LARSNCKIANRILAFRMNAKRPIAIFFAASVCIVNGAALDTNQIEQLTGLQGTMNKEEGVFKVSAPRKDNIDINAPGFAEKVSQFDKSKPILVNCHAGSRGAVASAELAKLGFETVCNLEGGLQAWEKTGHQSEQ